MNEAHESSQDAELHGGSHLTVDSLLAQAESTSSTFLYLLLSMLSLSSSHTLSHAASHLGVSQTISTLLRALPYHASRGKMVIPAEVTARHGVSQEEVFRKGGNAHGIDEAVFEFATLANDHLITAREMFKESGGKIPERARPVFLAAVSSCRYFYWHACVSNEPDCPRILQLCISSVWRRLTLMLLSHRCR